MKSRFSTFLLSTIITLAGFAAITYSSCTEDKCKTIYCANNGVCNQGACICPTGYEGTECDTKNRDRFKGIWQVTEHGTYSSAAQYEITIEDGSGPVTNIVIKNFRGGFSQDVVASVSGNTLNIPQQTINGLTIQGTGTLAPADYYSDHAQLTVNYSVSNGVTPTDEYGLDSGVSSVWTK